jgi:hypothetical protein
VDLETAVAPNLRRLNAREKRLLAATGLILAVLVVVRLRSAPGAPTGASGRRAGGAKADVLPRIDLARIDVPPPASKAGQRDLFEYGRAPAAEAEERSPVTEATPPPVVRMDPTPPPSPTLAPLNLKFIGSLDNTRGLKVAVLLTDKNEILTGQVGEVVANRYKIGKIGFESVDLEDVTSGQTRRIALRSK